MWGRRERKESRMKLRFLAEPTGRMKLPLTEMKKTLKEAGFGGGGEQSAGRRQDGKTYKTFTWSPPGNWEV